MKKKILLGLVAGIGLGCSSSLSGGIDPQSPVKFVNDKYHLNVAEVNQIDPAYLFVYSWNLYENGKKDDSVFWFYVAQYRAMIIVAMENENNRLDKDLYKQLAEDAGTPLIGNVIFVGNAPKRENLYTYIHSGLGQIINYYAGSNIDNWVAQAQKVLDFEKEHPFDPFKAVPAEQLDASKFEEGKKLADGLSEFVEYLKTNKSELEKMRK